MESSKLSEAITKRAFDTFDWPTLQSHLVDVGLCDATFEDLLGHLQRASGFILKYPNARNESRRDTFLRELREFIFVSKGEAAVARVTEVASLLSTSEQGYRGILAVLNGAEASTLAPDVRVAAYLRWAIIAYAEVKEQQDSSARQLKERHFPNDTFIEGESGRPVSMDAIIHSLVMAVSTSTIMESHKNKWHDSSGLVVLPVLPPSGDDQMRMAGSTQALAICWARWQRTELRRRFLGGNWEQLQAPELPDGVPANVTTVTFYRPDEAEFFDYAANERVLDRLGQQLVEVITETDLQKKVSGIASPVKLLPDGVVSLAELMASGALADILKYRIEEDTERPGGLRLVEWVRGFAVLCEIASNSYQADGVEGLASMHSRSSLLTILERCGLPQVIGRMLLERVTLKASSEDLFDAPLIQMKDGSLLVFGPALVTSNLSVVILSVLSTLQEPLSRKGRSLEASALSLFHRHQLQARGFKVTRDGEEYEYDAVLVWGDYIFVFECKNRSLSGNRPVNAYYFSLGLRSAARQVIRLTDALKKYPDILSTEMNVDVHSKILVPCVLNSLPYSRTADTDGVHYTDSSALERFFADGHFFVKNPIKVKEDLTVLHRVAIAQLWKGKRPSPEDLLRQLQQPYQLKILRAHTELRALPFPIDSTHTVMSEELVRLPWSIQSVAAASGRSAAAVEATLKTVRGQIQKLKKKMQRKPKRKARRQK